MSAITPDSAPFDRIRAMFMFAIIGGFVAAGWDGWWHTQYTFDGFFSPPHLLAYAVALILAWLSLDTVLNKRLRTAFGAGFKVFLFPYPVPGALVLLGGAVALLGFAGLVLDNLWHSSFGLNETPWSLPHAMIGWALLLLILGFAACRMALGEMNGTWRFALGWLVVIMLMGAATGPYGRNASPDMVRAEAQTPVYLLQPETQHLFNIYAEQNLTRTNPLFMLLAPLGGAAGLMFVRRMTSKPWLMLGVALLVSVSGDRNTAERLIAYAPDILENPVNYAPIPLFILAAIYVLLRGVRVSDGIAWAIGGITFALTIHNRFDIALQSWWVALFGGFTALIGARLGDFIYARVADPSRWSAVLGLAALGVGLPIVTGLIDLYWRLTLPA